jgi:hypothetical protein
MAVIPATHRDLLDAPVAAIHPTRVNAVDVG